MLPAMKRARTLSGLLVQFFRMRWAGLGKGGKSVVVVAIVIAAMATLRLAACGFGGCAATPCELDASPCTRASDSNEPCPYSTPAQAEPQADAPPCHAP